jgi:uncharacterized protein (DUF3820 family)
MNIEPNKELLLSLVTTKMPYGKYKGTLLCNMPEYYLVWFKQQGFPKGKLGQQLETLYDIKLNGLEYLLEPLKKMQQ